MQASKAPSRPSCMRNGKEHTSTLTPCSSNPPSAYFLTRPFQKAQLLTLVEYRSEKQCLRVKKVCTLGWIDHNRCTMEWIITAAMIFVYFSCIFVDFNVFLWNLMDLCCLNVIHEFFVDLRNLFVDLTDFLWI
ncbi:uncharacterized protein LOC122300139 isoform X2 [Carya illinoinensis]|uniref:uncharacterized protein LOC122300139 isoform X2 n=1 Tax=Carya illinoinensis TaxID=32201 RepID=UPI001C724E58|nr:uncharacterized protein LOC122300139 isoform X2 [Carya illinoinensis]